MKKIFRRCFYLTCMLGMILGINLTVFAGSSQNSGTVGNYTFSAAVNLTDTLLSASLGSNTADVRIQGDVYAYKGGTVVNRSVYARTIDYYVSLQSGLQSGESKFYQTYLKFYVNNNYATQLYTMN